MRCNGVYSLLACATLTGVFGANACLAGGDGVIVQALGDRLVIGAGDDSPGGQQLGQRVIGDVLPSIGLDDNPSFFSFSPAPAGFETLPATEFVSWDFLPITIDGVTSNLFHWDAIGAVDFAPAGGESLSLFDFTLTTLATVDGAAAAAPGEFLGVVNQVGEGDAGFGLHAHNFWSLQGEGGDPQVLGSGAAPTPGIYLTAMRLRLDGFIPSAPFFVALGTSGTPASAIDNAAVPWVEPRVDDLILQGDYNFDGEVDAADYQLWRAQFGETAPQPVDIGEADGNRDGRIDAADYTVWRDNLPTAPAPAEAIAAPEPVGVAVALAAIGILALGRRTGCRGG
ncbi:MAG: dockerin type I domain-containing protein [Planctomycetota bacterium]